MTARVAEIMVREAAREWADARVSDRHVSLEGPPSSSPLVPLVREMCHTPGLLPSPVLHGGRLAAGCDKFEATFARGLVANRVSEG